MRIICFGIAIVLFLVASVSANYRDQAPVEICDKHSAMFWMTRSGKMTQMAKTVISIIDIRCFCFLTLQDWERIASEASIGVLKAIHERKPEPEACYDIWAKNR